MSIPTPFSSQFVSTASSETLLLAMKPGCRGDPRMNEAVAAKLENPHMSLYDALVAGGFNYPRNVDAATMDNDRVTLGQRKNQLNRRLRMARKSKEKAEQKEKNKSKDPPGSPSSCKESSVGKTSPLVIVNSYIRQRRGKTASKPAATNRAAPVQVQPPTPKKQRLGDATSTGATHVSKGVAVSNPLAFATSSVNHQCGTVSPMGDDVPSLSVLPASNSNTHPSTLQDESWWPASYALLSPPTEDVSVQQQVNLVVADFGPNHTLEQMQTTSNKPIVSSSNSFASQPLTVDSSGFSPPDSSVAGQTAGDEELTGNSAREEIAHLIFQGGLQDLYKKSMVSAGFSSAEADDASATFHKFAFQAWKNECERLQVLLNSQAASQQPSPVQL